MYVVRLIGSYDSFYIGFNLFLLDCLVFFNFWCFLCEKFSKIFEIFLGLIISKYFKISFFYIESLFLIVLYCGGLLFYFFDVVMYFFNYEIFGLIYYFFLIFRIDIDFGVDNLVINWIWKWVSNVLLIWYVFGVCIVGFIGFSVLFLLSLGNL